MKQLNLLIGILIGITLFSCSAKDDGVSDGGSGFNIYGENYSTPNGYIFTPFDGASNKAQAIFISNGTVINNEYYGNSYCDFSNDLTQEVFFYIWPTLITELTDGTYTYDLNVDEPNLSDLNNVSFGFNISMIDNCHYGGYSIRLGEIESGSLTIEVSGNTYKLSYSFQLVNDEIIKGNFKGELQLIQDFS